MKTTTPLPAETTKERLEAELRAWVTDEITSWDALVDGNVRPLPGGADLWSRMPKIDSKSVARSSHIFLRHLGIPLDVKLIRPGGYRNVEEMIAHLVPPMLKKK